MRPGVALTGATGFIGSYLLRLLLQEGYRVRALVRPQSSEKKSRLVAQLSPEQRERLSWVEGDLFSAQALRDLLHGVQRVVHLAGAVRGADFEAFARANVKGTYFLLQALLEEKSSPPLLFVSSLAARHPYLSPYAQSKRAAEELFLSLGEKCPWAIFRPPAVYGPGDRELRPLIKLMAYGVVLVFGKEENRFSLIYVEDLARAILRWLEAPVFSRVYELHDGEPEGYDWRRVGEIVQRIIKRPVRLIKVPRGPLAKMGLLSHGLGRLLSKAPMITHWKVNELFHDDWVCDNYMIQRDLGWTPAWSLERGLRSLLEKV